MPRSTPDYGQDRGRRLANATRRRNEIDPETLAATRDRYQVRPRDWLSLTLTYEGEGTARFSTNPGTISGPTTTSYAEDGTLTDFTMQVTSLETERPLEGADSLFIFVHGLPVEGSPFTFTLGPGSNECSSLELVGADFTLAPEQRSPVIANAGDAGATFRPYKTVARYSSDAKPHYWVAPLLNFVVDYRLTAPSLHGHALRTRETAPLEAAEGDAFYIQESLYREGNALIPFLCQGEPAFIEPLPDYKERRAGVEAGEKLVTAVMVGRVPEDFQLDAEDWFPADLVTLLGLSSGRSVAVPFVEVRGAEGELVARMHVRIGDAGRSAAQPLIAENFSGTTGALLTAFLASPLHNEVWFRVVLKHLLRALTRGGTFEDRLSHLFRAVEGMSAGLGLNKARPIEVEPRIRAEIERKIDSLAAELDAIAAGAKDADRPRILKLKNRLRILTANSPSFETQLLSLVATVGLPDAQWLATFSFRARATTTRNPLTWASAAGAYRNRIVHSGFIDFEKFDTDNAFAFIAHLSDVLVRAVFRLIDFDGQYRPPCGSHGAAIYETPQWAQPESLSAEALRYTP